MSSPCSGQCCSNRIALGDPWAATSTASEAVIEPGDLIDRYRIVRKLGTGGMASVFLVRHEDLGTLLALKVLRVGFEAGRERLMQEGRIQASLQHPNIVAVSNVVRLPGAHALVMEYVDGPELSTMFDRCRPSIPQIDHLARQLLAGVSAAHARGLVHRDLKPSNVMLHLQDGSVVVKVMDFGLAKALEDDSMSSTRSGTTMGTPLYMSPEQFRNAKYADHRADVFSIGAILYELVTGRKTFSGNDLIELYHQKIERGYPAVRDLVPRVPDRMEAAILGALAPAVDERIATVDELLAIWIGDAPPPWNPWSAEDIATLRGEPEPEPDPTPLEPTAPMMVSPMPVEVSAPEPVASDGPSYSSMELTKPSMDTTWTTMVSEPPSIARRARSLAAGLAVFAVVTGVGLGLIGVVWVTRSLDASWGAGTSDLGVVAVQTDRRTQDVPGSWNDHLATVIPFGDAKAHVPRSLLHREFNYRGRTIGGENPGFPWIAASPVHDVEVGAVHMMDDPVDAAVWRALGGTLEGPDDQLVVGLSDAEIVKVLNAFSTRMGWTPGVDDTLAPTGGTGLRLPTEAEWEAFAAPSEALERVVGLEPVPTVPGRGEPMQVLRGTTRHGRTFVWSKPKPAAFRLVRDLN